MKKKYIGKSDCLALLNDKVYDVLAVENDWYHIIDESGEDYLYPPHFFVGPDEDGYIDMEVAEYIKNIVIWETK